MMDDLMLVRVAYPFVSMYLDLVSVCQSRPP